MDNDIFNDNKLNAMWVLDKDIETERLEAQYYKPKFVRAIEKIKCKNGIVLENLIFEVKDGPGGWGISTSEYVDSGVPMLRGINIKDGLITLDGCVYITEEKQNELTRSKVLKNDVLLAVRGSSGVGKSAVYSLEQRANMNAALVKITVNETYLDAYYLSCFFNCTYGRLQMERIANGVNQQNTNLSEVKSNIIPVPSLQIQNYIGDKVRKAEELREEARILKREAEDLLYKELKQEEFLEKQKTIINKFIWINNKEIETRIDSEYYKPNYILYKHILKKNGIMTLKIKDIVKDIKTGTTPESEFITQEGQNVKFLKVNNLDYCFLNEDNLLYIDNNYEEKKLIFLQQEDVLVSIAGTLGRSAVVDRRNCTTNQNIAALTLKNINDIKPYYLSLYFNSYFGKLSLDTISTQATIKYVNNKLLGEIEIPIIKIDTQILIENKVIEYKNKLNNSKQLIKQAKQHIEDLIEGNFDMSKIKETN